MEYARPLPLDASGRPTLDKDEVHCKFQDQVDLYNGVLVDTRQSIV